MATCANCVNEAIYAYAVTPDYVINYCAYHLPRFLAPQRDAGKLAIQAPVIEEAAVEETPTTKSKKKGEPVTEEAPAEDLSELDASN